MATLDEATEFAKVCYYGRPGTGKTTDAAHLAKVVPLKYVRADKSLRKVPLLRMGVPVDRIELVDELDPMELEVAHCWSWREQIDAGNELGVVVDTATELVARRIEAQVDEVWADTVAAARAVQAELTKDELRRRYFVNRDYYGVETQEMRRLLRHLRDLPCHVAVTAQVRRDVDENSGAVMYGPDVNPAIQGDLMAYSDFVIRLEPDGQWPDGGDIYIGIPRPDATHHGKDRDGILPRILCQPTMDRIVGYLSGELDRGNDPVQDRYRAEVKARRERKNKR